MNSTAPDIDKVTALLHEITHRLVLTRFSRLERREIEPKSTAGNLDDIVTIVDHQVEEQFSGCAAVEYTDIVQGKNEFVIYYRLLPWDHAAPALILTEAGGRVTHIDGSPYSVRSKNQPTVVAQNDVVADQVRAWLVLL